VVHSLVLPRASRASLSRPSRDTLIQPVCFLPLAHSFCTSPHRNLPQPLWNQEPAHSFKNNGGVPPTFAFSPHHRARNSFVFIRSNLPRNSFKSRLFNSRIFRTYRHPCRNPFIFRSYKKHPEGGWGAAKKNRTRGHHAGGSRSARIIRRWSGCGAVVRGPGCTAARFAVRSGAS
jgi:hypothetical protein